MLVGRRSFLAGIAGLTAAASLIRRAAAAESDGQKSDGQMGGAQANGGPAGGEQALAQALVPRLLRQPFWFLRHGETDWNAQNLTQGNIDIPLNALGRAQAAQAAERLRNKGIRTIVSSPLSRAYDTATAVARVVGCEVVVEQELHEVSFGERERQPLGSWYDEWVSGAVTPVGAESFAALRTRTVRVLNRAVAMQGPVLVVAHGGLFRAVRAEMGLEPNARTPNATPFLCQPGPTDETPWRMTPA